MAGIYIHIPFCKHKCSYCDFHFSTTFASYRERMINTIICELQLRSDYLENESIETIYFGGGTPSLLKSSELDLILEEIKKNFSISDGPEITLEANPDDISEENAASWKSSGINRLSIGIQSFRQKDLDWMNRAHNAQEAENAIQIARNAGFNDLTVDLIYGLPDLSNEEWLEHLKKVSDMGIEHLSAYCLTVEKRTALHQLVKTGKIKPAGEDQESEQFNILVEYLTSKGFEQYEISNFARKERYARHNTSYWLGKKYLGVGPSAHSFNGAQRRWNIANNTVYMNSMGQNENWFETEILSAKERWNELILTGLRTKFGVSLEMLYKLYEPDRDFLKKVEEFKSKGWMSEFDLHLILTKEGRLKADYIASELFLV